MERICTSFFGNKKQTKNNGGKDTQKNCAFFEMGNGLITSNSQRVPFVFLQKMSHTVCGACVCLNKLSLSLSLICSLLDDVFVITSSPSRDNSA